MTTLAVPMGKRARQLYGLAHCKALGEPSSEDGWDVFKMPGLDIDHQDDDGTWVGTPFHIAVRSAAHPGHTNEDDTAWGRLARRGASVERCLTELMVVFGCLLWLEGGVWHWRRCAEILQGPKARADRHNLVPKQWVAVLSRARVNFDAEDRSSPETWAQLMSIEELSRTSHKVRLDPTFRRELAAVTVDVPYRDLYLGLAPSEERVPNPEGKRSSRWAMARAVCSLLLELAPEHTGQAPRRELDVEIGNDLLTKYGMDLERVKDHEPAFVLPLLDRLVAAAGRLADGVASVLERPGSVLGHVLRLRRRVAPAVAPGSRPAGAQGHGAGRAGPAAATPSRGPPPRR